MMSLQAGEIYQVSSINIIIIIILSTLFNLSQAFNSVFSQLILMTLLQFLEFPLTTFCSVRCCTNISLVLHPLLPYFLQLFQAVSWLIFPEGFDTEPLISITSEKQTVVQEGGSMLHLLLPPCTPKETVMRLLLGVYACPFCFLFYEPRWQLRTQQS